MASFLHWNLHFHLSRQSDFIGMKVGMIHLFFLPKILYINFTFHIFYYFSSLVFLRFNAKQIDTKSEGILCFLQTKSASLSSTSYTFIGIGYCKTKTPCWSYIFILQCHLKNIRNNSLETKKGLSCMALQSER